jgi:drug/metabolite transporter (DMT)-like permease
VATAANGPMSARDWALLLALGFLWSGSYFFAALAVREVPPFTLVLARVGLAALTLLTIARATGLSVPTEPRVWGMLALTGFLNCALPFALIFWGQIHIASGLTAILMSTTPLFTILVAHMLTRDERLTGRRLGGVTVGLIGAAVLIGVDALRKFGIDAVAQIAILAAALSYAFAAVLSRKVSGLSPIIASAGQLGTAAVMILPFTVVVDRPWELAWPSWTGIVGVLGLALLSSSLAYIIYFRLLRRAGAGNTMLVSFISPVGASLLGILILGEHLAPHNFAGMALIFAGLATIDGRLLRALRGATA